MDSRSKRELEECVLRILEHGDPNKLTESKVRKLAADETGFDLTDPINRKLVKRVVEDFFVNRQDNGPQVGKRSQVTAVSRTSHAKQPSPKPERRRKLISLDDEEEEEEGEPEAHPKSNEVRESEVEAEEKFAKKGRIASRNPGRSKSRRNASESEESDRLDASEASMEDDGSRVAKKRRADGFRDDLEEDRFTRKKLQRPARRRHLSSDEAGSDEEVERRAASSKRKNLPSVRNKQRRTGEEEDDEEEEEQVMAHSNKRPDRKLFPDGDDPVLEISKNRFVAVQNFGGKPLVSVREYYEKDGKLLPSRKGISLTAEQWEAVKGGIPDIDAALRERKRGY